MQLISWSSILSLVDCLGVLIEIRWPHLFGSLSGFSIIKSVFPALCQLQALLVMLLSRGSYLWLQIPSSHPYGPTLNQRFEDAFSADLESLFLILSLSRGLKPILASFASPDSDFCTSRWLLVLRLALLHHALRVSSLETSWCRGQSHTSFFSFLRNESPYVARCQCLETTLLCVIFRFIAEGPVCSPFFHQGQKKQSAFCPIVFPSKFCTYYSVIF